ncbi:MAG: hypothetical protein KF883_14065 [Thermomicrobiales bacterium]|nr:hypothetical protein [Thermomicrobiales bacterium]
MEIVYGIAGVLSLGLFAAFVGFDARDLIRDRPVASWMENDPNSTIGVTRDVLAEQGESWRMPRGSAS